MKPNPFHVLELPVTADDRAVVERGRELALVADTDEERALAEWAVAVLTGRPETRRLHEVLEVPGTDYRRERGEEFARLARRSPVDPEALAGGVEPPGPDDFDVPAAVHLLLENLLTPPIVDVGPALTDAPVPFRLGTPPLRVSDVLFG
ncbi:hypothetical protein [Streptomyces acidicola]|uniref:hypothetical protein n=1 Tax=Streptomyces acidicola TaxID=2596892 RepID=UPI003417BF64